MGIKAQDASKKDLLALPDADWTTAKWWRSLILIPLRTKHDSGWSNMALVGVDREGVAQEVLSRITDDIEWPVHAYFRTDCYWPSGALRIWSNYVEFQIKHPGSSATIETREIERRR